MGGSVQGDLGGGPGRGLGIHLKGVRRGSEKGLWGPGGSV